MSYVIAGFICLLVGAAGMWIYKDKIIKAKDQAITDLKAKL